MDVVTTFRHFFGMRTCMMMMIAFIITLGEVMYSCVWNSFVFSYIASMSSVVCVVFVCVYMCDYVCMCVCVCVCVCVPLWTANESQSVETSW